MAADVVLQPNEPRVNTMGAWAHAWGVSDGACVDEIPGQGACIFTGRIRGPRSACLQCACGLAAVCAAQKWPDYARICRVALVAGVLAHRGQEKFSPLHDANVQHSCQ